MNDMEKRGKWVEFFDMSSDARTMTQVYYQPGLPPRPLPLPDNEDQRVDWALRRYESMQKAHQVVDDDTIPFLSPYTGTEIFAQSFGCRVHYPSDNMPFALPLIHSAQEVRALRRPSCFAPPLERAFRIARRLRDRFPEAPVQLPDIQSPFDIAALIWEKSSFYIAILEEPEAVEALCHMTEEVLVKFLDAWFQEFGTDYIAHYPDYFMRGGVTLSEDEAGVISPDAFRRFCAPALERLSRRYGGIGIHCCANSQRQWENFKRIPGLRLINLNQPPQILSMAFREFEHTAAQMHECTLGNIPGRAGRKGYPEKAHIVLYASAGNDEEARRVLEEMREEA